MRVTKYGNKGMIFEEEILKSNEGYKNRGIALVQKISTPVKVLKKVGNRVKDGFFEKKSTLDFVGTVKGGISISFDCKESEDERGLPLAHIQPHQVEYMKEALYMGEVSFILCYMKKYNKRYLVPGSVIIDYWIRWKANYRKKGFNYIPIDSMREVKSRNGIVLDYIEGLELDKISKVI